MKKLAKAVVISILGRQVRRLRKQNNFQIVAVTGSIGKTSTKLAIAKTLQQKFKVQYQDGNYNDLVTVPLIFFGLDEPSLTNPLAWLKTFAKIRAQLKQPYNYEVVVVEVGTDFPGNLAGFKKYLHADIGVLTAISPEHMEFFDDLDAVAREELTIAQLSDKLVVNKDLVADKYLGTVKVETTYDKQTLEDYAISADGPQAYSLSGAATVAELLGMTKTEIKKGLASVQTASGRGQRLKGINGSTIIDDTYNASPEAVKAALDMLYAEVAPQHIALLGNMNELGKFSQSAHQEIGEYCDPARLDLVVVLGKDAAQYLAPAAEARGCLVKVCESPYEAAEVIRAVIKKDAVILAKGSQNGVFAEEAVKLLLADSSDIKKLVRQSSDWLKVKRDQFGPIPTKG
jgi:UDP-N-acetylmuramoyl-tripeptide--D-alanyl-D-alanine ligase